MLASLSRMIVRDSTTEHGTNLYLTFSIDCKPPYNHSGTIYAFSKAHAQQTLTEATRMRT